MYVIGFSAKEGTWLKIMKPTTVTIRRMYDFIIPILLIFRKIYGKKSLYKIIISLVSPGRIFAGIHEIVAVTLKDTRSG
jgi:hypothetical protein